MCACVQRLIISVCVGTSSPVRMRSRRGNAAGLRVTQLVEIEGTLSMIHFAISDFSDVYKKKIVWSGPHVQAKPASLQLSRKQALVQWCAEGLWCKLGVRSNQIGTF